MKRFWIPALGTLVIACGSDGSTSPEPLGRPIVTQVNGVTEPVGLIGMTVLIEGSSLGDSARGSVYFQGSGGVKIEAPALKADWTSTFIIATVPQGTSDSSLVWIETTGGVSDSIPFTLISSGTFSPSNITWTLATPLPQALQGLGAVSLKVTRGATKGSYVFTAGGANQINVAMSAVYRATVQGNGAFGTWDVLQSLPAARAYHTVAAATPSTARIDDTTTAAYLYAVGGVASTGGTVNTVLFTDVALDGSIGDWENATPLPVGLHSAGAAVFRGFLYVVGGADDQNRPTTAAFRAEVRPDGTLGSWQTIPSLPKATAFHMLVNFGPYLYAVGGDTGTVAPVLNVLSGSETNAAYVARINMRDGSIASWSAVPNLSKARGKHGAVVAGGSVLATSGIYAGQVGSSENTYATIGTDGMLSSWNGATGANTIDVILGYGVYNAAAVSFIDILGRGHVLVLGGAKRSISGQPSAAVVYY